MSIFARSPFIVEISETGQEGSKVELFLWNGTGAAPANPSYTLSKLIPAANNVNTYYNISPYIREFISFDTRFEIYNTYPAATNEQWCNVIYKRYKLDGGVYTLLNTTTVKAYDGFGYYEEGTNPNLFYDILHEQGTFNYYYDGENPSTTLSRRAGYVTVYATTGYKAKYTNLNTGATFTQNLTNNRFTNVPRVYANYYADGNKLEILDNSNITIWTAYLVPKHNCKYDAVLCDFVNKYGAWQRTWFYAASNDTYAFENSEYNLMQSSITNYSTLEGQRKVFNTTVKKTIKVNTDWVDEDYKDLLKQLMASERILINSLPVKLNTKSTELFKSINTKTINYQLEFEFAFNGINNVI